MRSSLVVLFYEMTTFGLSDVFVEEFDLVSDDDSIPFCN